MIRITFIDDSGNEAAVGVNAGQSVMEAAVANHVPGIDADCGGACACGTCHVYVDEAWVAATGACGEAEAAMLEFADGLRPNSRLCCQIKVSEELDGLVVRIPERPS